MKNKYLSLALLTAVLCCHGSKGQGQQSAGKRSPENASAGNPSADSVYVKQRLSGTDIQVMFSFYTQNGDHSSITGGEGTEKLLVYSPSFSITKKKDSINTLHLSAGVDVISSASKDKIDYVMSSASRVSARTWLNGGYSRLLKRSNIRVGINSGFSIESAYFSLPAGLSLSHVNRSGSREVSASLQCFFDDLRYGWLNQDYFRGAYLIYPVELRNTDWFTHYRRNSYNVELALYQVINARIQFAFFPGFVYQRGLLSTTYNRVYFNDNNHTEKVEKLPGERWKLPLAAQLNIFAGPRFIIRTYYRYYRDDFGVIAHTFQLETPFKVSPEWTLTPLGRFYTQTAADWFRPHAGHSLSESFYTSDYDLSSFRSYKLGLNMRYVLPRAFSGRLSFNEVEWRYAWYHRSDGLQAHILSLLLNLTHTSPRSKQ